MDVNDVIVRPIISEKSMNDVKIGKFTFQVVKNANKRNVREAVENKFKVHVVRVATTVVKGRTMRTGLRRIEITKGPWKKALVTLQKGEKIGLFELGGDKK